ncbi:hypothetical protein CTAYLR_003707 [Chrysophaeum taylorii]|uniref:Uncharacterized protein n=1 Tax=Chrysophaeum taylorii TaxID=2483200 RepID=A0AAD7XR63_9STRA|nr:hypothetical protein CTAYLR_003707 [Chrysophaeum taylorii]
MVLLGMLFVVRGAFGQGGRWDAKAAGALLKIEVAPPAPVEVSRSGDGVIYALGGSVAFVAQEVLPAVRYLARLGPKPPRVRYALFAERRLVSKLSSDERALLDFFDAITSYEDVALPAFLSEPSLREVRVRVKAIKAHAFLFAPFERFVFLDFDSRPCVSDFAPRLFARLGGADAVLHNQWTVQEQLVGEAHYEIEHNSAIAVFDATTPASSAALRYFVAAFETMRPRRDQPPLMVALRAAVRAHRFTHADLPAEAFCRRNTSRLVSCDAGCLVVHKPQKYDPGRVVVALDGLSFFRRALATLKIVNRKKCDDGLNDLDRESLDCRVVGATPGDDDLNAFAATWPRAKFVQLAPERRRPPVDPSRLFVLDLAKADHRRWRDLCSFLEVWSSCKTSVLADLAKSWSLEKASR